jgi:hypothetical protein
MKNFKKYIFTSFSFSFRVGGVFAKKDKSLQANEEYADNKFVDAEANYRFQIQNSNRTVASYNLGNAIYKQTKRLKLNLLMQKKQLKH